MARGSLPSPLQSEPVQLPNLTSYGGTSTACLSHIQGQQLMDLERKLLASKEDLEKTALDKVRLPEGSTYVDHPVESR